jgi:hypothetical protein
MHPVAVADPPLRYELLPSLVNQHPGNAAYEYAEVAGRLPPTDAANEDFWSKEDQQLTADPGAFSASVAAGLVDRVPIAALDAAARCERADWENGFREHGLETLLPQVNPLRTLADLNAIRTRAAVARGDWAGAQRGLQTGFAMARHVGGRPSLIQALVATGMERLVMDRGVEAWLARSAAPNLYWPLSALPPSFVDLYAVAEVERAALRYTDQPWVALALDDQLPPGEWARVTAAMAQYTSVGTRPLDPIAERRRLLATLDGRARDQLRSAGRPAADVAAMSVDEAVGRYLLWQSTAAGEDIYKAWTLPFPQAGGPLERAAAAFPQDVNHPLASALSPWHARYSLARTDEQLAALRVIEALRDYAARHGGRPPSSLGDIADLPIPPDPVTGRPFDYHADGATATLDLPVPPGVGRRSGRRYELTFVTP